MKIKILADLPVAPAVKPEIGSVHEVVGKRDIPTRGTMYSITVGRGQVGVFENECEILPEEQRGAAEKSSTAPSLGKNEEPEL